MIQAFYDTFTAEFLGPNFQTMLSLDFWGWTNAHIIQVFGLWETHVGGALNTGAVQKFRISHHSNEHKFLQHFTNE